MKNIMLVVVIVMFSSCAIHSAKTQNMYYLNLHKTAKEKFHPTKKISSYDYTDNNVKYFTENGYIMVGYDAIRHTYIGYQEAVNAGCWIGATVMLYKHQYIGTASGRAVVPMYNPGETYTLSSRTTGSINAYGSSTASAYGNGGYAYGSSQSSLYGTYNSSTIATLTTPGSFSYYSVPYSKDYYDQYAIYFVKKYYRIDQGVNFYTKADTKSKKILIIPANSWFQVTSSNHYKKDGYQFIKIKYNDIDGFILNYPLK